MTADLSWPPVLDPPASLSGRLQRGLGSGAREVLFSGASAHRDLVLDCIATDPRLDRQLDSRADYYAQLALITGVQVSAIERLVYEGDARGGRDRDDLALEVLGRMAVRDAEESSAAVRAYLGRGRDWGLLLVEVLPGDCERPGPDLKALSSDFAEIIMRRFESAAAFAMAAEDHFVAADFEPWSTWAAEYPFFRAALGEPTDSHDRPQSVSAYNGVSALDGVGTSALLSCTNQSALWNVAGQLTQRTSPRDVDLMIQAAADPDRAMQLAAVTALARQHHEDMLPVLREFAHTIRRGQPNRLILSGLTALPYEMTQPDARCWLCGDDPRFRRLAGHIMSKHSAAADIDLLLNALDGELEAGIDGDHFQISYLAEALGRHPENGPYGTLERAFNETAYSYGRTHLARAIAATDPSFSTGLAIDCLWDAEPTVRATAAQYVPDTDPAAACRLAEMRTDLAEDADVRAAASARASTR